MKLRQRLLEEKIEKFKVKKKETEKKTSINMKNEPSMYKDSLLAIDEFSKEGKSKKEKKSIMFERIFELTED